MNTNNLILLNLVLQLLLMITLLFATSEAARFRTLPPSNITAKVEGTHAILTLNGFQKGESGGAESECDSQYHSDEDNIVALSSGWYNNGKMCFKCIKITRADGGHGTTTAKVVDECDSKKGGCRTNIVDGSKAVWKALGFQKSDYKYGETKVTWDKVDTC